MASSGGRTRKQGPVALAEIVGKALDPVTAKRGFATAELVAAWGDIVGAGFADCSQPEKVVWPRGRANEGQPGVLVVRVEGPRALLLQHEVDQIVERANAFVGHGAISRIKIVQGQVRPRTAAAAPVPGRLNREDESCLAATLAEVNSDELRLALDRLGRAVFGERDKKS